jgi:hypothetical protein
LLKISNSVFVNNTCGEGAQSSAAEDGGAVFLEGTQAIITDCYFINNRCSRPALVLPVSQTDTDRQTDR